MKDQVTIYSELIEDIVDGTFFKHVIAQRKSLMAQEVVERLQSLDADTADGQVRITENLLRFIDTTAGFPAAQKENLPKTYQKYFFNQDNESMELINDFVVAANKVFKDAGVGAKITTAKVAARLRGQFLHLVTSDAFQETSLEVSVVNNGLVTFIVEDPQATIEYLSKII